MQFSLFLITAAFAATCSASSHLAERNTATHEGQAVPQIGVPFMNTFFKCRNNPKAPECRRPKNPWLAPNLEGNEMNALTGPQLWDFGDGLPVVPPSSPVPTTLTPNTCPIEHCTVTGPSGCGLHARCIRGYCVCELGLKADDRWFTQVRGWEGLEEVTVHVQPQADCKIPCDTLACKEVSQVMGCIDSRPRGQVVQPLSPDPQLPETSSMSMGAIKAPGTKTGIPGMGSGGVAI